MKEFALKGRKIGGRLPGSNIVSYIRLSGAPAGREALRATTVWTFDPGAPKGL